MSDFQRNKKNHKITTDDEKIVMIGSFWIGSNGGGIKKYLNNLVNGLIERKIDVSVIFSEGTDQRNYKIDGNFLIAFVEILWILHRLKPNVIHTHDNLAYIISAVFYKMIYKCKLIHTFHTDRKRSSWIYKSLLKLFLERYDCATFVSKGLKAKLCGIYDLNPKVSYITYPGVDYNQPSNYHIKLFLDQFHLRGKYPILLANGLTALQQKAEGAKILIEAVKKLRYNYPNIMLILTREGAFSDELKEFAKIENIHENIVFTGDIDEIFIPLSLCDIYTHISLSEGLPLAILEAMSIGKPILATPVGGIPEAILDERGGILVSPNADQIANKINFLLQNPEFANKLGLNAITEWKKRFKVNNLIDSFILIYKCNRSR